MKSLKLSLIGLLLLYFAQLTTAQVTVTPELVRHNADFHIEGTINYPANAGVNVLHAETGIITVSFPQSVILPSQLAASDITVSGTNFFDELNISTANSVTVNGNQLLITTPIDLAAVRECAFGNFLCDNIGNNDFTITISENAGIINPSDPGNYTISYAHNFSGGTVSSNFSLSASNTSISQASVATNPSIEFQPSAYTIGFNTGSGGFLIAGEDEITLEFPPGTSITSGNIAGIKVNGTSANAIGNPATRTLTVTPPIHIGNNADVIIQSTVGSGITNPGTGTHEIEIHTTAETTETTSLPYTIREFGALSVPNVMFSKAYSNALSAIQISFTNSNTETIDQYTGFIELTFPESMQVPASLSSSSVTITSDGFTATAHSVDVTGNTIRLYTRYEIAPSAEVIVAFSSSASVRNPATSGVYSLMMETNTGGPVASSDFYITQPPSSVSKPEVDISNNAINQSADYTINFITGEYGRLIEDESTITVTFPQGTSLQGLMMLNNQVISPDIVMMNNGPAIVIPVEPGNGVSGKSSFELVVQDVQNPGTAGNYTLSVFTSSEPKPVRSQPYAIGFTSVVLNSVTLSQNAVNRNSAFAINFQSSVNLFNNNNIKDVIRIQFPNGYELPIEITPANISISGGIGIESVQVSPATNMINVVPASNIAANTTLTVTIQESAGIVNPPVPSTNAYRFRIFTSGDLTPVNSQPLNLVANNTAPSIANVNIFPSVVNSTNVLMEVDIQTGSFGKLTGSGPAGTSFITLTDPNGSPVFDLPGTLSNSAVLINGENVSNAEIAGGGLRLYLPESVTIDSESSATITFLQDFGLGIHNVAAGNYTLNAHTSAESAQSPQTNNVQLTAVSGLRVDAVSLSPRRINETASYNFLMTTGNSGALNTGQTISIEFPDNTQVPSSIPAEYIEINGTQLSQNASASDQTLTIPAPEAIGANEVISIRINSSANIMNPSMVASNWRAVVSSEAEPAQVQTPTYATAPQTSTISNVQISLDSYAVNELTSYLITFQTGSGGRLVPNMSTIIIDFPESANIESIENDISINGVSVADAFSIAANRLQVTIPDELILLNDDNINIEIQNIRNPDAGNQYQLNVFTSVEPTPINSNYFTIGSASDGISFSGNSVFYFDESNVVNAQGFFRVDIETSEILTSNDYIEIIFPQGTFLPAQINNSAIQIENNGNPVAIDRILSNPGPRRLRIFPETDVSGPDVSILFGQDSGIRNTAEPGMYSLQISTSSQPQPVLTDPYEILASSTRIENLTVNMFPQVLDTPVDWEITFHTGELGALGPGVGTIRLNFGDIISFTKQINPSAIRINGIVTPIQSQSDGQLVLRVPNSVTVSNGSQVKVTISPVAGIQMSSDLLGSTQESPQQGPGQLSTSILNTSSTLTASTSSEPTEVEFNNNPLPVEIIEFNVENSRKNAAHINWETATETNNFGFYIERAFLGFETAESKVQWEEIGFSEGRGNSSSRNSYSFVDEALNRSGSYQYRLVQVDYDGNTEIFGPQEIIIDKPEEFRLDSNYPNPFNPVTTIPFAIAEHTQVHISIYDVLGRRVQILLNEETVPGHYQLHFDGSQLASGVYFVRMVSPGQVFTKKMMLVK